jgi:hypothetical protein
MNINTNKLMGTFLLPLLFAALSILHWTGFIPSIYGGPEEDVYIDVG